MGVKNKDEILEAIKTRVGDNTDDETISLLEDVSDTLTDLETRASGGEDWKTKYEENDKLWRERYTNRFFSKEPEPDPKLDPEPEPEPEPKPAPASKEFNPLNAPPKTPPLCPILSIRTLCSLPLSTSLSSMRFTA